ncbi:MAG: response regulator [Deltaproteobacteria bacterium]|nr:response regulator [Deltaproteobacteria bacterium]
MSGVDPTLLALFDGEAQRCAKALRQGLERDDMLPLVRVLGALRSAAALAGLQAVQALAIAGERVLEAPPSQLQESFGRMAHLLANLDAAHLDDWLAGVSRLTDTLTRWVPKPSDNPNNDALATGYPRRTSSPPSQSSSTDPQSSSTVALFQSEVRRQSKQLVDGLLILENGTAQPQEVLESLMRAAHSIKGAARVVRADRAVSLVHMMEDLFVSAKEQRSTLDSDLIDLLLTCTDALQKAALQLLAPGHLGEMSELSPLEQKLAEAKQNTSLKAPALQLRDEQKAASTTADVPLDASKAATSSAAPHLVPVDATQLATILELSGEALVRSYGLQVFHEESQALTKSFVTLQEHLQGAHHNLERGDLPSTRHALDVLGEAFNAATAKISEQALRLEDFAITHQRLADQIHREVLASKMRPVGDVVAPFPRMVRDITRRISKVCVFHLEGCGTLVDRDVLEALEAPLLHLLRNALDHGLEPPDERRAAGKPESGTLSLVAAQRGDRLFIDISDDGRGINLTRLRQRIVARNLASREITMRLSNDELYEFLFLPGFTTASKVTDLSGRGVGLDVVQEGVKRCGGTISVHSKLGEGTTFSVSLPLSRSVVETLVVELIGELYAFTREDILRYERVEEASLLADSTGRLVLDDDALGTIPLMQTRDLLDLPSRRDIPEFLDIVILRADDACFGLLVDRLVGEAKLALRSLDARLGRIPGINGAALTPRGEVVLLFDGEDLRAAAGALISGRRAVTTLHGELRRTSGRPRILVAEDSATVRENLRQILEARGFDVDLAVDGMDAWAALSVQRYSLLLTDIDMPRMSGLDLLRLLQTRSSCLFDTMPAIVISYKSTAEDREVGLAAGAQAYLSKSDIGTESFDATIEALLRRGRGMPQ